MRQNFTYTFSWILIIALAVSLNYAYALGPKTIKRDTINYFSPKKAKKKGPLTFSLPPIKPGVISETKVNVAQQQPGDKLLGNVEVYPNPITDQINLKYSISRNSTVSIKMLDILGNATTLFSQRVEPGEQTFHYAINSNKISKGFYFIRVVAGTEFVIRRVSIL